MKIALVTGGMDCAGVPKSCIRMLKEMEEYKPDWEITLFLTERDKTLIEEVPKTVDIKNVKLQDYDFTIKSAMKICVRRKKVWKLFILFYEYFKMKYFKSYNSWVRFQCEQVLPQEDDDQFYDIVIAYQGRARRSSYFALNNLQARIKLMWIHEDIKYGGEHGKDFETLYRKFNRIVCVSENAKKSFVDIYPDLKQQVDVCYNRVNLKEMFQLAALSVPEFYDDAFNILTVGRLSKEKGVQLIPEICQLLKTHLNKKFVWHIVGDGVLRKELEEKVKEYSLQDSVKFYGNQKNPFPYYKYTDLYVQPSYTETFCLSACEALAFNKFVVISNIPCAHEILNSRRQMAAIVDITPQAFAEAISSFYMQNKRAEVNVSEREEDERVDNYLERINQLIESNNVS